MGLGVGAVRPELYFLNPWLRTYGVGSVEGVKERLVFRKFGVALVPIF